MKYLQLIRYQNLLLLALMQLTLRFGFLKMQNIDLALSNFDFILLVFATVFIAAGGYIINDIFDQGTDAINKPRKVIVGKSVSESKAYNLYVGLTILGVAIGFWLSNTIEKPNFAVFFILVASILYFYSTTLKQMLILGNLAVALVLASSVVIIGIFDVYPVTTEENQRQMAPVFGILIDYAVFAFIINFIREIVKDIQDIDGDKEYNMNTLAVKLGTYKTAKLLAVICLFPIGLFFNYMYQYFILNDLHLITLYSLIFILSPLIYCTIKLFKAQNKNDFSHISTLLKVIILFGIFLLPILNYTIEQHA
ncbi:4-hydroxybenzoate polyprenyltransferase [Flavobacterium succinicans]|uniref:4-hydroxybenzoate polyprenyltransferase n=1 Tax=Flavobacterium succinicans TaxID=29536 RepID=A0A1I4W7V1_9FLAO|nr:geranylgeranylglycerol-phosphate geranylgeranyltransferase [Flavobacterium succinicans]SFN09728.1 4-hydroxybenzoate polyprenyltransferase [Flavobacterium succinicans]